MWAFFLFRVVSCFQRAEPFVREYHRERRLTTADVSAIVTYMKCRGLQLQQRLRLRGGADETVMARARSVCTQEHEPEA
jgi:hypothetical protein